MQKLKHLLKLALKVVLFLPALILFGIMRITTDMVDTLDDFYYDD